MNSHVEREINEVEAAVVRRIFDLCAGGTGYTWIAKQLNAEGAPCPRPQQGRPAGWAPSSVKTIIDRRLYLGDVVWNQTKKRDKWGQKKTSDRPECDWLRRAMPELRVVSDDVWNAVHARLDGVRKRQRHVAGNVGYRRDVESKYLLSGFARCAVCGVSFYPLSRSHGKRRAYFYGCHQRGRVVHVYNDDPTPPWSGEVMGRRCACGAELEFLTIVHQHIPDDRPAPSVVH